uniref:Uncharacterized protein n=1 Tax=Anguilla anguilla TaxID=7936 RepID=A0A0E9SPS3_ANGAN
MKVSFGWSPGKAIVTCLNPPPPPPNQYEALFIFRPSELSSRMEQLSILLKCKIPLKMDELKLQQMHQGHIKLMLEVSGNLFIPSQWEHISVTLCTHVCI